MLGESSVRSRILRIGGLHMRFIKKLILRRNIVRTLASVELREVNAGDGKPLGCGDVSAPWSNCVLRAPTIEP